MSVKNESFVTENITFTVAYSQTVIIPKPPMQRKPTTNQKIYRLVSEFEEKVEGHFFHTFDDHQLLDIISFYEKEKLIHKAIEAVDLALSQYKYRVDFYLLKVRLLLKDNEYIEAYATIQKAESFSPFEFDVLLMKAKTLNVLGHLTEALDVLDLLQSSHPARSNHADICLAQAMIYENMKDYDSMFDGLKDALLASPLRRDLLEKMWMAVEFSKRYEDSVKFHLSLIDSEPYNAYAWYNLGHAYSCVNEYEKAIEALEYSFLIVPDFQMGYRDCAELCMLTCNFTKAREVFEEELHRFGPDSDLLCDLGACYLELKQTQKAFHRLAKSHTLNPYNDEATYLLAVCHARKKQWKEAVELLHEAIKIEDRREEYYAQLAAAYHQLREMTKADFYYRKATETGPEQLNLWIEHAQFLFEEREYEEALRVLEEAEYHTVGIELNYCKGACLLQMGQEQEGLNIIESSLNESPEQISILDSFAPHIKDSPMVISMMEYFLLGQ